MSKLKTSFTFTALLLTGIVAQAQQLPAVPSNFDTTVWARPTKFPALRNYPQDFGQMPSPCAFSHLNYDDPIQKFNQPRTAPLHVFAGNSTTNASSTYASLRSAGVGSCFGGPVNRSAIYFPSVMNGAGQVVLPDLVDVFYRGTTDTQAFPRGLKMIFGYDEANPSLPWDINNPVYSWSIAGNGGYFQANLYGVNMRSKTLSHTLPTWVWNNPEYAMNFRVIGPSCWDGVNLDSLNHRSHLHYGTKSALGIVTCPASHPVKIPETYVTATFRHLGQADVATWYLSSDRYGGRNLPRGTNLYVGMIPAWDDGVMTSWVDNILKKKFYGSFGKLGDGRILEKPLNSLTFPPTAKAKIAGKPYFLFGIKTYSFMTNGLPAGNNNLMAPPP